MRSWLTALKIYLLSSTKRNALNHQNFCDLFLFLKDLEHSTSTCNQKWRNRSKTRLSTTSCGTNSRLITSLLLCKPLLLLLMKVSYLTFQSMGSSLSNGLMDRFLNLRKFTVELNILSRKHHSSKIA